MDLLDTHRVVEGAALCAKDLRAIVESLPAQTFGGDLSRDFIVEGCNRAENPEPRICKIECPDGFLPTSRLPRTVVGILGGTGVGKSKLLSVLLGKDILPTSGSKRGTSFPTVIVYHPHPTIEAAVSFMSLEDFGKHVETAIDFIKPDEDGNYLVDKVLKEVPSYALLNEALGLSRDELGKEGVTTDTILAQHPDVFDLLGQTDVFKAKNEKDFLKETTKRYIRRTPHLEYKKWPLVNLMVVKCNADLLSEGGVLVDLPGSSDVSATVMRKTEDFKDKLHFTLGAARVERSEDDAGLQSYIEDEVARQRRMQGNGSASNEEAHVSLQPSGRPTAIASALAVIITKCDSTTNVKLNELERDNEIWPLLRKNKRYMSLRKRSKTLEARINGEDEESDTDELDSDDETLASPPNDSSTRKRSHSSDPVDVSASKRLKPDTGGNSDVTIKLESPRGPHGRDSDDMDVDQVDPAQWEALFEACERERKIIAAGMRSQVICRTIRKQYKGAAESLKGDIAALPLFATSAEDYTQTRRAADRERTGIPAIRAFVRNLGAHEQHVAALNVIQPFRAQVTSVLDLLSTVETQGVEAVIQQKRALMERWASCVPICSAAAQMSGVTSFEPQSASGGIQVELKESLNAILKMEIDGVRRKLADLEVACKRPLPELASKHVPQITKKIVQKKRQYNVWRAFLRHNGAYRGIDWNRTLAAPLVHSMKSKREELFNQWNQSAGSNLRSKLIHAGVQVLSKVIHSANAYDASLLASVKEHVTKAISAMVDDVHHLQQIVIAEVLDADERASRPKALVDAVEDDLKDIYKRALDIKGTNSTVKQKDLFEEAVNGKADAMFAKIVKDFIKARQDTIDRVEAKIVEALDKTAKEAELSISPVWTVVGHGAEQIAARKRASEAVKSIHSRLIEMETALKTAMERAEQDVPLCYPPPTIPDDE